MASADVVFFTTALSTRIHFSKLNSGTSGTQRLKLGDDVQPGRTRSGRRQHRKGSRPGRKGKFLRCLLGARIIRFRAWELQRKKVSKVKSWTMGEEIKANDLLTRVVF